MNTRKSQLTQRQKLFCELYVSTARHCAALAARLAGYAAGCSHVTGCQLLQKPKIAATVRGLEAAIAQDIGVSRKRVIADLLSAAELAKSLKEPGLMISATKNIAQICGYYGQGERHVADKAGVQRDIQGMTDEELLRMVEAGRALTA